MSEEKLIEETQKCIEALKQEIKEKEKILNQLVEQLASIEENE